MSLYGGRELVGPGAMTEYGGGPGRQRSTGYVRVSKAPDGFFVAGSSLKGINGLYGKVNSIPKRLAEAHEYQLAYKHDQTKWHMALVSMKTDFMGNDREWVFIDEEGRDRFSHKGDSIVPGSGKRWKFVHRSKPRPQHSDSEEEEEEDDDEKEDSVNEAIDSLITHEVDDEEELPWQLIAILSEDMVEQLRRHYRYYEYECRVARNNQNLPKINAAATDSTETDIPEEILRSLSMSAIELDAQRAMDDGRFDEARDSYEKIITDIPIDTGILSNNWQRTYLLVKLGRCHRHLQQYSDAMKAIKSALRLFPYYKMALLELGINYMDQGIYQDALESFERVLRVDREFKDIERWLIRIHTHMRRVKLADQSNKLKLKIEKFEEKDKKKKVELLKMEEEMAKQRKLYNKKLMRKHEKKLERKKAKSMEKKRQTKARQDSEQKILDEMFPVQTSTSHDQANESEDDDMLDDSWADEEDSESESVSSSDVSLSDDESNNGDGVDEESASNVGEQAAQNDSNDTEIIDKRWVDINHYAVLAVPADFTEDELKKAYKKISRQVHPDRKGGSVTAFQRVADAYKTLEDTDLREKYDMGTEVVLEEIKVKRAWKKMKQDRRVNRLQGLGYGNAFGLLGYDMRQLVNLGLDSDDDSDDDKNQSDDDDDDDNRDKKPLKDELEKKYFPERFPWCPFGDPHEDRKKRR